MKKTILYYWKKNFKNYKNDSFFWDNTFWMQTKKDFIIKTYLISNYIKRIEWKYIWIMLPSVWSASILIISTYLAGKIPVMFNWTLWKEAFDHCVSFSKVDKILTSSVFYSKVTNEFLEKYNKSNKFIFLEDLLKDITLKNKVLALIKSIYLPIKKIEKNAVILFTSGSEALPKAVCLTHKNIIENIKWSLNIFSLEKNDKLLWFLPPFHSFWFTINTIMPLITWMRVVYTPDPNDAKTILEIIKHTKITALTSTPTFFKMIMWLAKNNDLQTIRYVVLWAEKCPLELFEKFKKLSVTWKILEWYWITECSPVVSINPLIWSKKWTVWKILPNLDCKIINLDTNKESKIWEQWMIYLYWSSIFNWYLDKKLKSPFKIIVWKKYYETWDLWFIDKDWFLTITWRIKRFIKIAWEMISLPFIENILLEKYSTKDALKIAIEAIEKDWVAKITLFSVERLELEEVNDYLRNRWVSNLIKISNIYIVDIIPLLWTWKVDYRSLKKLIL